MNPFFLVIISLHLSFAIAAYFTQVLEWPEELDYEWPSEASRTQALKDGTFKTENIYPRYMAVHGSRIFLSLYKDDGVPATLVSLPTNSASSPPPKLNPFPSWDMNEVGNCEKIQAARGLEVDAVGRLWVLDSGSDICMAKIWIADLYNNDHTKIIYRFSFHGWLHDLVLDETPNETLAYILRWNVQNIVVFSLERNQYRMVEMPGIEVNSIALSPKKDPRQLYLGKWLSKTLYSISVTALRNGAETASPKLIGNWTAMDSYRMLVDNHGTMHAASLFKNYLHSWNTSQPFQEQRFHLVGNLTTSWPFTFALDSSRTLWLTVFNYKGTKPRCKLLKAAVGAKPYYISKSPASDVSTLPSTNCTCERKQTGKSTNSALIIGSFAFFLVLSCIINLWLTLRMRKLRNSSEQRNAGAEEMEMPTLPNPISPEMVHEEIENDLYGVFMAPPSRPRL